MIFYHVVSDRPKKAGQHILLDGEHPNGVHDRVYAQLDIVEDIYKNPGKYEGTELTHEVDVALRELALEEFRGKTATLTNALTGAFPVRKISVWQSFTGRMALTRTVMLRSLKCLLTAISGLWKF